MNQFIRAYAVRLISIVLAGILTVQSAVQPVLAAGPTVSRPFASLVPPAEMGVLSSSYAGQGLRDSGNKGLSAATQSPNPLIPQVILIQDLHFNYSAQKNISRLLNFLHQRLASSLQLPAPFKIAVEGAIGPVDNSVLTDLKNPKLRAELSDFLMQNGELAGSQYYSVMSNQPKILQGIEDPATFQANLQIFRQSYRSRMRAVQQVRSLKNRLETLKPVMFSKPVLKLEKARVRFEEGKTGFYEYWKVLSKQGLSLGVERSDVLTEYLNSPVERRAEMEMQSSLYQAVADYGVAVQTRLAKTRHEANLIGVLRELDLAGKVLNKKVTLDEAKHVSQRLNNTVKMINLLLAENGGQPVDTKAMTEALRASVDFYIAALLRNRPMLENILKLSANSSQLTTPVVAVVGGFHTDYFTSELRKKGISYAVFTPQIDRQTPADDELYTARIMGERLGAYEAAQKFTGQERLSTSSKGFEGFTRIYEAAPWLNHVVQRVNENTVHAGAFGWSPLALALVEEGRLDLIPSFSTDRLLEEGADKQVLIAKVPYPIQFVEAFRLIQKLRLGELSGREIVARWHVAFTREHTVTNRGPAEESETKSLYDVIKRDPKAPRSIIFHVDSFKRVEENNAGIDPLALHLILQLHELFEGVLGIADHGQLKQAGLDGHSAKLPRNPHDVLTRFAEVAIQSQQHQIANALRAQAAALPEPVKSIRLTAAQQIQVEQAVRKFDLSPSDKIYLEGMLLQSSNPNAIRMVIGPSVDELNGDRNFVFSAALNDEQREKLLGVLEYVQIQKDKNNAEAAKNVVITVNPLDGGIGESLDRRKWLSTQLGISLEQVKMGAKGTDLGFHVPLEVGTGSIFISIAEARLLQYIPLAKEKRFAGVIFQPLVNDASIGSYYSLLAKKSLIDPDKTYRQAMSEVGIELPKMLRQRDLPGIIEGTTSLNLNENDSRQPGGHGQWGVHIFVSMANSSQSTDKKTHIRFFQNGDNVNAVAYPALAGLMGRRKLPIVMLVTPTTPLDAKGGKMGVRRVADKLFVPEQMEIGDAKALGDKGLRAFAGAGLEGDPIQRGKQPFNANLIFFNENVLRPILQELRREIGDEEFARIVTPGLIKKKAKTKGYNSPTVPIDGAIGSAVHRLNAFMMTDPRGQVILQKADLDRLLFYVNVPRNDFFAPVKLPQDMWLFRNNTRYQFDRNTNRVEDLNPTLPPPWIELTDPDPADPKNTEKDGKYWAELQTVTDALGERTDVLGLSSLRITGRVSLPAITRISGQVKIETKQFGKTFDLPDTELKDVHIVIREDGGITRTPIVPPAPFRAMDAHWFTGIVAVIAGLLAISVHPVLAFVAVPWALSALGQEYAVLRNAIANPDWKASTPLAKWNFATGTMDTTPGAVVSTAVKLEELTHRFFGTESEFMTRLLAPVIPSLIFLDRLVATLLSLLRGMLTFNSKAVVDAALGKKFMEMGSQIDQLLSADVRFVETKASGMWQAVQSRIAGLYAVSSTAKEEEAIRAAFGRSA